MSIKLSTLNRWVYETNKVGAVDKDLPLQYAIAQVRYENSLVMLRSKKTRGRIEQLSKSVAPLNSQLMIDELEDSRLDRNGVGNKTIFRNKISWELLPPHLRSVTSRKPCTQYTNTSSNNISNTSSTISNIRCSNDTAWQPGLRDNYYATIDTINIPAAPTLISKNIVSGNGTSSAGATNTPTSVVAANPVHLPYSAVTMLTKAQLVELERRCSYLSEQSLHRRFPNDTTQMRPFYVSSQIYHCGNTHSVYGSGLYDVYSRELQCCMTWLLPVRHFDSLFIHHIGTPGVNAEMKWPNRHRIQKAVHIDTWHKHMEALNSTT